MSCPESSDGRSAQIAAFLWERPTGTASAREISRHLRPSGSPEDVWQIALDHPALFIIAQSDRHLPSNLRTVRLAQSPPKSSRG
jgi:hypothetical protein